MITLLRDENVELRERIIDTETDYVILNESYKNFITVSKQKVKTKAQSINDRETAETHNKLKYPNKSKNSFSQR